MQDAPISHVDILACRNTFMYFNAETQAQILNRLHFALQPDGVLFLGKAEMLLTHSTQFRPVELRQRIFRKLPGSPRNRSLILPPAPIPPATPPSSRGCATPRSWRRPRRRSSWTSWDTSRP
ncbi:CheR family methyltransferase [Georgenia sp. SUBG003]|uniref:CheR family methyltransferase n=1 Tax=Georgenia sp. SUBG003 TaxID=1497974 RepID=UPI003AB55C24